MILLGGITRLMGAGLSIVDWQPIIGILPPFSEQAWQQKFTLYQQFPEYQKINFGMTLAEFKPLFWMEYGHRLWGRLIGLVLIFPTLIAIFKKPLRPFLKPLGGVWILGGLQGVVGWYMVKSGLINNPSVSPYRLTVHLFLALIIVALFLWMLFPFMKPQKSLLLFSSQEKSLTSWISLILGLMLLTICMGSFTAGLKAGHLYNTFPTMNGQWVPDDILFLKPLWRNFFENSSMVQFCHRVLAISTWLMTMGLMWRAWLLNLQSSTRKCIVIIGGLVTLQLGLGIATVLLQVPLLLGLLHQATAVLLFSAAWWLLFLTASYKKILS
ncbi:MAG: COX15/CtaA family protein [Alphaproteobacteria bacterium]|nr:COX15/CtaA family protein [Alphaproteobacteria bacterium]